MIHLLVTPQSTQQEIEQPTQKRTREEAESNENASKKQKTNENSNSKSVENSQKSSENSRKVIKDTQQPKEITTNQSEKVMKEEVFEDDEINEKTEKSKARNDEEDEMDEEIEEKQAKSKTASASTQSKQFLNIERNSKEISESSPKGIENVVLNEKTSFLDNMASSKDPFNRQIGKQLRELWSNIKWPTAEQIIEHLKQHIPLFQTILEADIPQSFISRCLHSMKNLRSWHNQKLCRTFETFSWKNKPIKAQPLDVTKEEIAEIAFQVLVPQRSKMRYHAAQPTLSDFNFTAHCLECWVNEKILFNPDKRAPVVTQKQSHIPEEVRNGGEKMNFGTLKM